MKSCSLERNATIRRPVNLARRGEPHDTREARETVELGGFSTVCLDTAV